MITLLVAPHSPPNILIYAGAYFRAEWYYTAGGVMPGLEYYKNLPVETRVRLMQIVKQFCDRSRGDFMPDTMYRLEDSANKIYAFKPVSDRFFNFTAPGARVIITNAYRKSSGKMSKQGKAQCKVAAGYKRDYQARLSRGEYYG